MAKEKVPIKYQITQDLNDGSGQQRYVNGIITNFDHLSDDQIIKLHFKPDLRAFRADIHRSDQS